jgi:hypothetical protein
MVSSTIQFPANDMIFSSLWLNNTPLCIYTHHVFFIQSSVDHHVKWNKPVSGREYCMLPLIGGIKIKKQNMKVEW